MQASWTNWHASSLTMCFELSIHRLHEDLVVVNTLHHWYSELMRLLWRLTWLSRVDVRGSRGKMVLWRCESFGLFQEDKQVWNKWEKKIKGQLVHPRSPAAWKTFTKTVCVCVCYKYYYYYYVITSDLQQEVKVIWQKAPHGGPFPG